MSALAPTRPIDPQTVHSIPLRMRTHDDVHASDLRVTSELRRAHGRVSQRAQWRRVRSTIVTSRHPLATSRLLVDLSSCTWSSPVPHRLHPVSSPVRLPTTPYMPNPYLRVCTPWDLHGELSVSCPVQRAMSPWGAIRYLSMINE